MRLIKLAILIALIAVGTAQAKPVEVVYEWGVCLISFGFGVGAKSTDRLGMDAAVEMMRNTDHATRMFKAAWDHCDGIGI